MKHELYISFSLCVDLNYLKVNHLLIKPHRAFTFTLHWTGCSSIHSSRLSVETRTLNWENIGQSVMTGWSSSPIDKISLEPGV